LRKAQIKGEEELNRLTKSLTWKDKGVVNRIPKSKKGHSKKKKREKKSGKKRQLNERKKRGVRKKRNEDQSRSRPKILREQRDRKTKVNEGGRADEKC